MALPSLKTWSFGNLATFFNAIKQAATEGASGVVELATTGEAAAGVDTQRAVTPAGLAAGVAALASGSGGNENGLINGNFDWWQRNTSFTAAGYTADRWKLAIGTGATVTLTRQSFTLGQTDVPGEPRHYLRMVRGAAGSSQTLLSQRMEGVRSFAGQTATLTFWAKADAATTIKSRFNQHFGTGGSPSANVNTSLVDHSVTTSWTKFTSVVAVPSISGKTMGTGENDYLEAELQWPHDSNGTGTVEIARVSVVKGDVSAEADVFVPRLAAAERVMCERFYEYGSAFLSGGLAGNGARGYYVQYKTRKRAIPTIATSNEDGTPSVDQISAERFRVLNGTGNQLGLDWTAAAEL